MRRRDFLLTLAATAALPRMAWARAPLAAACARDDHGFALIALDMTGRKVWRLALPSRGHGIAAAPTGTQAIVFGRRPGAWAILFDPATGAIEAELTPPAGHYFCGHGLFVDGDHAVATMARRDDGEGFLGVFARDARWRTTNVWSTGGPDPHEVVRWPEGGLVVANGGYRRDPDTPRLAEMDADFASSMTLVDTRDGAIVQQQRTDETLFDLSLRHLAVARGQVFIATQLPRMVDPGTPMVLRWRPGEQPTGVELGPAVSAMRGYCGSIVAARDGNSLCVSSPRGGVVLAFTPAGNVVGRTAMADVCAIMARDDGFMMAGGRGDVVVPGHDAQRMEGVQWDNHMVAL
jgi:hypothetical protein